MVKVIAVLKLIVLLTTVTFSVSAQTVQTEDAKKSVARQKGLYIYQFLKNVEWPKELLSGDLIVGVYGDENVFQQLSNVCSGKFIGSHKLKVIRYISNTEINKECHFLYVAENKSNQVSAVAKKNGSSTLIIGNKIGLLSSGAIINFIVKDNKLAFEINKTSATKANLTFSQLLSKLAINVI
jgi:hypothetical protein